MDEIRYEPEAQGWTRVELRRDGRSISHLSVAPLTINVGAARVRVDGIAGVETDEAFRRQGCARRVLDAALARMRAGDAALSILYGIPDFYPRFGYATAGPDYLVHLTNLDRPAPLPPGWTARPLAPEDLPAVRALYEQATTEAAGAVQRPADALVWSRLAEVARGGVDDDGCRIVERLRGGIAGYAWRATSCMWAARVLQRGRPEAFVIGETVAAHPAAADAALAVCRAWAGETSPARPAPAKEALLSFPPEGPLAAAVLRQQARCETSSVPAAGFMACTLDVGRLLLALQPELARRAAFAPPDVASALCFQTDLGDAFLDVRPDGRVVVEPGEAAGAETISLPQTELMRLALGAFPPDDILDRLAAPPSPAARRLIATLFPPRHPYLHLPDRI